MSAASTTTATICISSQTTSLGTTLRRRSRRLVDKLWLRRQMRGRHDNDHLIRVSAAEQPQETTIEGDVGGGDDESSVETTQVPYSLISQLNVEKALRGIAITDADHYGRLGLSRGCSYDQVTAAYKTKCEELINEGLDEEQLKKKMELLKESYYILSSEEERRLYDWSLSRIEGADRYVWPFEADITQTSNWGDPPPQEPEDVGPTRLVGYFFLGWLVLSFVLSIALNR
ncbi:hypothetical protein Scep_007948 [Stephania cephalantha]|uniref:J domain-containing protein n=1 Tax=Stephania cephalantha TaxID=152367 RepID=A0AAP0KAU4_9MAGN